MQPLKTVISLLVQLLLSVTVAHATEAAERTAIRTEAAKAYRIGDIESLERQHAAYSAFLTQRTSSGAFKMTLFFDGIAGAKRH